MRYVLPPMHTLRTFEAVSRLRSFARAAEELHLTASAVSHQIRAIESFYATRLLRRDRREATPTAAGERLLAVVQGALRELSSVGESLRAGDARRLTVTAPPSLASRWLMPRLGNFLAAHPQIDFKLHATTALVDLDAEQADFAIRYGGGRWPGLRSTRLFDEYVFPVVAPALAGQRWPRGGATLLRDDFHSWEQWSAQTGERLAGLTSGPVFSDSALLLQAAEAGQGAALGRSALVADALAAGTLVRVGARAVAASGAYYLAAPSRRADSPAAALFRQWMTETAVTHVAWLGDSGNLPRRRTRASKA